MKIERQVRLSFVAMFKIKANRKLVYLLKKKPPFFGGQEVLNEQRTDVKCLSNPMHLGGLNVKVKRKHKFKGVNKT